MRYWIGIFSALLSVAPAYGNLLVNFGFENNLSMWVTTGGSASYAPDSTVSYSGLSSAKGTELDRNNLGRLFQDVTGLLVPGEEYTISGWIKTQDVIGGGGATFELSYVDAVGTTPADGHILTLGFVTGTQDWAFFGNTVPFVLPSMPIDTVALHFSLDFSDASGIAWFDSLALIGPSAVPPSTVPEPATLGLLGMGLAGLGAARRRHKA